MNIESQIEQAPWQVERELADSVAQALRRNHREGWAWDYQLPFTSQFLGLKVSDDLAYRKARAGGYDSLCQWLREILPGAELT